MKTNKCPFCTEDCNRDWCAWKEEADLQENVKNKEESNEEV